jgi:hypothetical protein
MRWLWRALPKSFSASRDRMSQAAGIIFEPGNSDRAGIASRFTETNQGTKTNRPRILVRKLRRVRLSWRTSAV